MTAPQQPVESKHPLAGRHALVTGGARGIGEATARALLGHGARVTILGRDANALAQTVGALATSGTIGSVRADVSDANAVARAFTEARDQSGPVGILINNAGAAESTPFRKTDAALWRRMMAVNLDGTFYCIREALPAMIESGWGRIVNVASAAGLVGYRYVSAYCAAKHGVVGLTRALALETAKAGVTVNAVCPGYVDTDMTTRTIDNIVARTGAAPAEALATLTAQNPQNRLLTPVEVAHTVVWLCLPGTEAITGQAIAVPGGEVM
jgi:NAD(P)-dependent dehydrogenase (short-subunit alcohol dehydrogenase family)